MKTTEELKKLSKLQDGQLRQTLKGRSSAVLKVISLPGNVEYPRMAEIAKEILKEREGK